MSQDLDWAPGAEQGLPMLAGGGEMGAAMRAYDWLASPLGCPAQWPASLRTAVSIMLNSGHPMFITWGSSQTFLFNDAYRPILGAKLPGALGRPFRELWGEIWDQIGWVAERALAGESSWFRDQKLVMWRHGFREETYFTFSYSPIRDETGTVAGIFCACTETTQSVLVSRRMAAETDHLRRLFEQAPGLIVILRGPDHVFELANASYRRLLGGRDLIGRRIREAIPEAAEQGFLDLLNQVYETGEAYVGMRMPVTLRRDPDGPLEERHLDFLYQPILDKDGAVSGIFVEGFDVTEQVHAEQALHRLTETLELQIEARTQELRRAEEALRQSQKMEALGQLTGGIAHDFNNLLLGINGSLSLAERRIAAGRHDDAGRFLRLASNSANRAAALTHRLLAFSRRQPLDPKPIDANRLVGSMVELLHRTLGEAIDLQLDLAEDVCPALCDLNQLESALLNLAINARDAMPEGGRLTISTANAGIDEAMAKRQGEIQPGDYVRFAVTDTGMGMSPAVIARAFDPFFTTKPLGRGTGLGLSMIYGFARQSGGVVKIDSLEHQGTTVQLFLPRGEAAVRDAQRPTGASAKAAKAAAGETVLVVEDEGTVRELVVDVLQSLGYQVLEARDGPSGLQILRSSVPVDLLVTDIGLPGLNGRQMVDVVRQIRPNLKVLFMTGYAENAIGRDFSGPGMGLITKPFSLDAFTGRVREMLQQQTPGRRRKAARGRLEHSAPGDGQMEIF